jgi:hypothetical protein
MHLVLRVLGLAHIKDNLVGSGELRGISGARGCESCRLESITSGTTN